MSTEGTEHDMSKILFTNLVMMLSSSAMQQMGKIVNPATNKTEVHLEAAQVTIDMLEMLKKKTEGNLDDDETRMFTDVLSSLQMTYVETARAEGAEETAGQGETEEASKAENNDTPPEETAENTPGASADGETKEPKYHKSYGDG